MLLQKIKIWAKKVDVETLHEAQVLSALSSHTDLSYSMYIVSRFIVSYKGYNSKFSKQ